MADKPPVEFGKRRATPLPPEPGPKRSHHVALLLMGTLAVGGSAYAVLPRHGCASPSPGMAAPAPPSDPADCASHGWSGGSHSRAWHAGFSAGDTASSGRSADAAAGNLARGGFGAFARALGFSGRS